MKNERNCLLYYSLNYEIDLCFKRTTPQTNNTTIIAKSNGTQYFEFPKKFPRQLLT
jgi:hypothetical protein